MRAAGSSASARSRLAPARPAVVDTQQPRSGDVVEHVLVALADPTRRQLLELLCAQGQASATILAEDVPISRQAVVKHLTVLDGAGLVEATKVGREVRYTVRPDALDTTARWMSALAADWDRRLAKIKRFAEAVETAAHDVQ